MRVDVRSKDYHGDLVIATALALWSAVGTSSGRIEVGQLDNWSQSSRRDSVRCATSNDPAHIPDLHPGLTAGRLAR